MSFMSEDISVEVIYISPDKQVIKTLKVPIGTTAIDAIHLSGIKDAFPEVDFNAQKIGVFGRLVKEDDVLQAEDRVEIYRSLVIDPKEARRRRAEKK